ncbi:hypothetical protein B5G20_04940 [Collinsella sp. An7]|uniref:DUF3168 domain-containing protein n=1 Tax=Collinsella sp. An7 TaxID=1965651 RepID=UPI000B3913B1|nr:DUF3168 domain-containing protein [Collinsella sp. An7]OUN47314.1 hypothetical protein B5G20_04940 [Collinsella sp. An7]
MDAERACVDYLNACCVGAPAYYDVPDPRPSTLVVVERTGGGAGEGPTSRPVLDIQCWAGSRRDAALLAQSVGDALADMPGAVENVAHASVASTFRDRDLESGSPRYHLVCELYANE